MTNPVWLYDKVTGLISKDGVTVNGAKDGNGYILIYYKGKMLQAHRLAYVIQGLEPPPQVDHINGIKDDNRWVNLRPASNMQNQYNRKGFSKQGHAKGAYYNKCKNVWFSTIRADGKTRHLGTFKTEREAAEAYMRASLEIHGEYSVWKKHGSEKQNS